MDCAQLVDFCLRTRTYVRTVKYVIRSTISVRIRADLYGRSAVDRFAVCGCPLQKIEEFYRSA